MRSAQLKETVKIWPRVEPVISVPHTEKEYARLLSMLDELVDEVGDNEDHPCASLMETIGTLIASYEDQHVEEIPISPIQVLKHLMEDHQLTQGDMPEIGSQGVVSEVLCGKRELNLRQIRSLSKRFGVSPIAFV